MRLWFQQKVLQSFKDRIEKILFIRKWQPWGCGKWITCLHRIYSNCKFDDSWRTFQIAKKNQQKDGHKSNERNWRSFRKSFFVCCSLFWFFCAFYYLFWFRKFHHDDLWPILIGSEENFSKINGIIPIGLNFNLKETFLDWGSRSFLFLGCQDIVGWWECFSKISRICRKKCSLATFVWHEERTFWKPVTWQLACFITLVQKIVLLLPLPSDFAGLLPTLFAVTLKVSSTLTTSTSSGAASSITSAPKLSVAGTTYLSRNGTAVLPSKLSMLLIKSSIGWNLYLSWRNHLVVSFSSWMNVGVFSNYQNKSSAAGRNNMYFVIERTSEFIVTTIYRLSAQRSELNFLKVWYFNYCGVAVISAASSLNQRERNAEGSFCLTNSNVLGQIRSRYMNRKSMQTLS